MDYPNLTQERLISLDTETTGTDYPRDEPFSVIIATADQEWYWDLRQHPQLIRYLNDTLGHLKGRICCHNASFDVKMLIRAGVDAPIDKFDCTIVRACLIDEHRSTWFPWGTGTGYSLDALAKDYLNAEKYSEIYEELAAIFGGRATRNVQMPNLHRAPPELVAKYAIPDARLCYDLYMWQEREILKQGIVDIVQFEREVMPLLIRTELRGVHVDVNKADHAVDELSSVIVLKQDQLNKLAGRTFNANSPKQMRELFSPKQNPQTGEWVANDGTVIGTTVKGAPSFGGNAMDNMTHPAAKLIVELRSLIKTRDTFLKGHILGHEVNGVVYPTIDQTRGESGGTVTGRLSYRKPALQQIPSRNPEVARIVKACFIPPPGMVWVEPDLNSFEVRVFAHLVGAYNQALVERYRREPKTDFHQMVADDTGLPRNPIKSGQANAKQLNLSMIFNQGDGATAEKMGLPWEWSTFIDREGEEVRYKKAGMEAKLVIENYHRKVPGVRTLATKAREVAERRGYIKTFKGRRLRFPGKFKSYKASGLLIQATSADINKRNWIKINEAMGRDGHLILNVHDSYALACPEDWEPAFKRVKEAIEDTSDINLRVPLILDLDGVGHSWYGAKNREIA